MKLARAGLRLVAHRKAETAALVTVVVIVMFVYGFSKLSIMNLERHIYLQMRESIGDVAFLVPAGQASTAEKVLEGLGYVDSVRALAVYMLSANASGKMVAIPAVTASDLSNIAPLASLAEGRPPSGGGEAAVYVVPSAGPAVGSLRGLRPGDSIEVIYHKDGGVDSSRLRVTGVYEGYTWILRFPYALVLHQKPSDLEGSGYALLAVTLQPGVEAAGAGEEMREALTGAGVFVYHMAVNTPELNPVVGAVRAGASFLTMPAAAFLALAAILPASVGVIGVFRDLRGLASLRAMGAGAGELALYYTIPWLARAAVGVLLAAGLIAVAGDDIYFKMMAGGGPLAERLAERYSFNLYMGPLASAATEVLALTLAGSLAPLALALHIDLPRALRSLETPTTVRPPRLAGRGPVWVRSALREGLSRWWKLAGSAVVLGLVWGVAAGMDLSRAGLDAAAGLLESRVRADVLAVVEPATSGPPAPTCVEVYRIASNIAGDVLVYHYEAVTEKIRGSSVSISFYAPLRGDPSLLFPLSEGRYPAGPGEALTSRQLADYLGVGLGGIVELAAPSGSTLRLRIVGLSDSPISNSFYVVVAPGWSVFASSENMTHCGVAIEASGNARGLARSLQERLASTGWLAPTTVLTKQDLVARTRNIAGVLEAIHATMSALAGLAAGVALAGLVLADISSRAREYAVYKALGTPSLVIHASQTIQVAMSAAAAAPLAALWARLIAGLMAASVAPVVGYYPPHATLSGLAGSSALWGLAAAYLVLAAALAFYIRRLDVASLLRE